MRELEFIEIIKNTLSKSSYIGDDCAYLKDLGILITQDSLVEDVHFSRKFCTPCQLAYKAIIVNLSDIFASGAIPKYVTISLSLPKNINNKFISGFYTAVENLSKEFDFEVIGGDITGSDKIFVSVCAIGLAGKRKISSRKNAKVGDYVVITGNHGSSAAGLFLLEQKAKDKKQKKNPVLSQKMNFAGNKAIHTELQSTHDPNVMLNLFQHRMSERPCDPEINSGRRDSHRLIATRYQKKLINSHLQPNLQKYFSNDIATKTDRDYAMMDTSDGLIDALFKIAQASNVLIAVDFDKIPYDKQIEEVAKLADIDFRDWILYGGEDYQLVACIDKKNLKKLSNCTVIGQVKQKNENNFVEVFFDDKIEKITDLEKTFNHFGGK